MNWSGGPASDGMFSICEMPFSPWQPTHSSAFSLPAAMSTAWAEKPENANVTHATSDTNLRTIEKFPSKNEAAAASNQQPQPRSFVPRLLAVADAVDRTGPVVGDEQRAVLGGHDVGRTAEIALIAFEPAGGKDLLLGVLAVGTDDHALDAGALVFMPIPGAVFGNEDVVLVLGGELVAGIELHAERRHMRAELGDWRGELPALVTHRKFRIRHG